MTPRFDPSSYPGQRPEGPVVVHQGAMTPLQLDAAVPAPLRVRGEPDRSGDAPPILRHQHDIRWSVAYGSNASPERLMDKGLDVDGAVLVPARMSGWVPAFEARQTGYGAVPLTLVPEAGAEVATWVLGLLPEHLDELDRTEGRVAAGGPDPGAASMYTGRYAPPGSYVLGRVGDVAVAERFVVRGALAYLPGPTTLVQHTGAAWRSWPEHDQAGAARGLHDPGAATAAPRAEPVLGPWPQTPLEDLPLFVYGTLQPDQGAWTRIAELVEVVGPATAPGSMWDTGNGWPAASFAGPKGGDGTGRDAGAGQVRGTVVAPIDTGAAVELIRRTDAYEGVPELFRRVAVRVDVSGVPWWAVAYEWAATGPAGLPIADGRWPSP